MAESSDYTPAPHWDGYDFASAKRAYVSKVVDRGAVTPASIGLAVADLAPEELIADSESPLIIACDVTGSMGDWPATIFSKLPYLEFEGKEYLGEKMQICFAAIGDGYNDKYPLQVRPFVEGVELQKSLEKLIVEKGGGGTSQESYELAGLYFARNCQTPNAIRKPIMIIIGDEGLYENIPADIGKKWAKVDLKKQISSKDIFEELKTKFAVYVIRKPYNCYDDNKPSEAETRIQNQWCEYLGDDHVVSLPSADRVVDVIFGILAKETGRIDYFRKELEDRQGKDKGGDKKVSVVLNSLKTVHSAKKLGPKVDRTKSVTKKKTTAGGRKSISLLDE